MARPSMHALRLSTICGKGPTPLPSARGDENSREARNLRRPFKQGVILVESAADSVVAVVLVGWDGCEVRLCDLCARVPCER